MQLTQKLALVSVGSFLSLALAFKASAEPLPCPNANSRHLYFAESANYKVSICSSGRNRNTPSYYVAANKNGRGGITLPLSSYRGIIFTAKNGSYTYTVNGSRGQLIVQLPNGKRTIESLHTYGPLNHYGH